MVHERRERIYIRKDIILKLVEHGELNQSQLMSYCGLNNVKHKAVVDELVERGLIIRVEEAWGTKKIIRYRASEKGRSSRRRSSNRTRCYSRGATTKGERLTSNIVPPRFLTESRVKP